MSNNDTPECNENLAPAFCSNRIQVFFEFVYLVILLALLSFVVFYIHFFGSTLGLCPNDKILIYALTGSLLGGWLFDAKWFYQVVASNPKSTKYIPWKPSKFYWRMLIPYTAGIVAFATYLLATSEMLPIRIPDSHPARSALGLTIVFGYFSDLMLSKLAQFAGSIAPSKDAA